jgi:hypothetical protein
MITELAEPKRIDSCPACTVDGLASKSTPDHRGGGTCSRGHFWSIVVDRLYVGGIDEQTFARVHNWYASRT